MKLTLEKKETIEVDIALPTYKRYGSGYYAILNENNWLQVCVSGVWNQIEIIVHRQMPCYSSNVLTNGQDITEEEFWSKWNEAREIINKRMEAAPCV